MADEQEYEGSQYEYDDWTEEKEFQEELARHNFELIDQEPGNCDKCGDVHTLYVGDRDYWDSRDCKCLCAICLRNCFDEWAKAI